jgi:class 3 adenylate cyclase
LGAERVDRRLAAILAADVAGYSRLMERDEASTLARLRTLRRDLIDRKIAEHKGRIVKTTGDGLLIELQSVLEAVACAGALQRQMVARNDAIAARLRELTPEVMVNYRLPFRDPGHCELYFSGLAPSDGMELGESQTD